jgi:hypothetical protein
LRRAVNDELVQRAWSFNEADAKASEHHAASADCAAMLPRVVAYVESMHAADRRLRLRAGLVQRYESLISTPCCPARCEQSVPTVRHQGIDQ